jgi:hypothetical protein
MADHRQELGALGASDCEAWHEGLLHQPVNSLSSLAYLVAGVWIATRPRADRADRLSGAVYAGAVLGNGVGSLLYHGPGWPGSTFVHDAAVPAVLLFIAVDDLALLRRWPVRRQMTLYALALGASGVTVAVVPAAGVGAGAVAAVAAAAAEAMVIRRGHRAAARTLLWPAATLLLAGLAGLAGRTESPLCRPDGILQGHAAWHLLTAAALAQWDRLRRTRRTR